MGERKVLNKYIPPDFDPSKIPKGKGLAKGQMKVQKPYTLNPGYLNP
jgi:hypothetical protein